MIPPALQKIPLPPTIPTTVQMTPILEQADVAQPRSNQGGATTKSTSPKGHTAFTNEQSTLQQQLDKHSEDDTQNLQYETPLRILLKIDQLKRRARQCMTPQQAADVCRSLKNISDDVHHSQAKNEEVGVHLLRMASVVISTIQI